MSKWDEYQDFSTNAKPHGGANAYLDFLNNHAKEEGRGEGRIEGGIAGVICTVVLTGVTVGGIWVYGKAKEYFNRRKLRKQLAADVRREFLNNVERHNADDNAESLES